MAGRVGVVSAALVGQLAVFGCTASAQTDACRSGRSWVRIRALGRLLNLESLSLGQTR